jgi:pimeloyl-ACP methyl ester carboxylesterase
MERHDSNRQPLFRSFDGTEIHYDVRGEGHPVVLLHGFIVDGSSWEATPLYHELLRRRFKVMTLDMRGNGRSDRPHDVAAYEHDAEARDIIGLTRALGVDHYAVVGYSRGSIIASRLLLLDTGASRGVLGGMGADFTDANWPRRQQFYAALTGEPVEGFEQLYEYLEKFGDGVDKKALALLQKAQPTTTPTELAGVQQPVLVISGDADFDNGSSAELARLLPRSTYRTVPGDHVGTMQTEAFAREVIEFLNPTV